MTEEEHQNIPVLGAARVEEPFENLPTGGVTKEELENIPVLGADSIF